MPTPARLTTSNSQILVIDLQDKLLATISSRDVLIDRIAFLLEVGQQLDIPIFATEQYPKGLGPTDAKIAKCLPSVPVAKTSFSCCGTRGVLEELRSRERPNIVLVGMETHVCILQTALDLLVAGFTVFLPDDCLSSRNSHDHRTALKRLFQAGGIPTTSETIAFEWLEDSTHPEFKSVSQRIKTTSIRIPF